MLAGVVYSPPEVIAPGEEEGIDQVTAEEVQLLAFATCPPLSTLARVASLLLMRTGKFV